MRSRKCTATLTLVLIGAAVLQGCGQKEETATRDVYRSLTDCQRDWGDAQNKCDRVSSGTHAGYYYGPAYGYGRSSSPTTTGSTLAARSGSHAVSSTSVSRGGFGSSASSHSSGG